jgi:hypothetical protein
MWWDSVSAANSGSGPRLKCGPITYQTNIISAPSAYVHATMGSMFTYSTELSNNPPASTIKIAPTLVEQIGTF